MVRGESCLPRDATVADWSRGSSELNELGAKAQKADIQLGFHNHNFEFKVLDGTLIYDKLMSELAESAVNVDAATSDGDRPAA